MNLVVVPSATSGSPSSNAWPARPHLASSRHILPPTSLRALHRVPSSAAVRAYPPAPRPSASSGSVNSLETGSESPLSSTSSKTVSIATLHQPSFKLIEGLEEGPVILVRVPRSLNAPHMVIFNEFNRFYARHSGGRYAMNVREIRQAFLASELLPERIRSFRNERVTAIVNGDLSVPLS